MKGYLAIILHAHLPYVRHPEHEHSLEEKWFFEAMTECYIPLLRAFEEMKNEGTNYRVTFSLSPTLLSMMEDPFLQQRYSDYLQKLKSLAQREVERTSGEPAFHSTALMYRERINYADHMYNERCGRRLVELFKELMENGHLEIITSAATHGYLPLLGIQKESIYAQLSVVVEYFESLFGTLPRGIWLPECAYDPSLEEFIKETGVNYFITDTHGVLYASPRPKYGVYSPILTPGGTATFARDPETSKQVWSAKEGYPGDFDYREYYRDIGFDLDMETIGEFLHPPGLRGNTGFKYHRITGNTAHKEPYRLQQAMARAEEHAGNFIFNREKQVEYYGEYMDRPPLITAPYDTELFGHWWFEGPWWLEFVFRKIAAQPDPVIIPVTPGEYLDQNYPLQVSNPNPSSWGDKGYHEVWLNESNDWLYRHLHMAAQNMVELASAHPRAEGTLKDALNQAARELLLAQSSDWPFIITAGTMDRYATGRAVEHLLEFFNLEKQIRNNRVDVTRLRFLEAKNNIFPHLDYSVFQDLRSTVPVEKEKLSGRAHF